MAEPSELPTWQSPPVQTPMMPVQTEYPQYSSPRSITPESYIVTEEPMTSPKSSVSVFKYIVITLIACIGIGGAGGAYYIVQTTTASITNASKTQQDVINEILEESEPSFSLIEKVEAGYEDPFIPSAEESNPFLETTNPFDEIGY